MLNGKPHYVGKVGRDVPVEEARAGARLCALNHSRTPGPTRFARSDHAGLPAVEVAVVFEVRTGRAS